MTGLWYTDLYFMRESDCFLICRDGDGLYYL